MSVEPTNLRQVEDKRAISAHGVLLRLRRWESAEIDARLRKVMILATLLVIPDLILEEQPLRAHWHAVAVIGDWAIWLVFGIELMAIMLLAKDWRSWLRSYPLAPAMLVLTPPFAPAAIEAFRAFRLLRLLRVARGFQLLSKLLTLDGLKYIAALAVFLILGGGGVFADVESHVGHHISSWEGIWWAIGTITTEGSSIQATTDAGRAIAIVLMLAGIGTFSILTGAVAQHFLAGKSTTEGQLSYGEEAIMARLDELASRLHHIEATTIEADSTAGQRHASAMARGQATSLSGAPTTTATAGRRRAEPERAEPEIP